MKCTAKANSTGKTCTKPAVAGATVCVSHGAAKGTGARRKADVRAAVRQWQLDDIPDDPGQVLLRAMTVTWWQAAQLRAQMAQAVADGADPYQQWTEQGYRPSAIALLEQRERQMAADMAAKAVAAGIADRQVRILEQHADQVVQLLRGVLTDLHLDPADPAVAAVVTSRLRALEAAA